MCFSRHCKDKQQRKNKKNKKKIIQKNLKESKSVFSGDSLIPAITNEITNMNNYDSLQRNSDYLRSHLRFNHVFPPHLNIKNLDSFELPTHDWLMLYYEILLVSSTFFRELNPHIAYIWEALIPQVCFFIFKYFFLFVLWHWYIFFFFFFFLCFFLVVLLRLRICAIKRNINFYGGIVICSLKHFYKHRINNKMLRI